MLYGGDHGKQYFDKKLVIITVWVQLVSAARKTDIVFLVFSFTPVVLRFSFGGYWDSKKSRGKTPEWH